MPSFTNTFIYQGDFGDGIPNIDPDGTGGAEGAGGLVGQTYTSATMSTRAVTVNDVNNDGYAEFDGGAGGENVTYDLGAGPQTENVNQGVWADALVTLSDGSSFIASVMIFQTSGGKTFLGEFGETGELDSLSITSIEVTGINNDLFSRSIMSGVVSGSAVVCFTAGTQIATPSGPRLVEALSVGDLVMTLDAGALPVRALLRQEALADGQRAPVCFAPGAIGPGMPLAPLSVSPQHCMLCASPPVERMFGVPEVLVPAKRFLGLPGVAQHADGRPVTYVHLQLARHSVLAANGALVESCLMGAQTTLALPRLAQGLRPGAPEDPCRLVPQGCLQRAFVAQLVQNARPMHDGQAGGGLVGPGVPSRLRGVPERAR
jgi:hypothetical protein